MLLYKEFSVAFSAMMRVQMEITDLRTQVCKAIMIILRRVSTI